MFWRLAPFTRLKGKCLKIDVFAADSAVAEESASQLSSKLASVGFVASLIPLLTGSLVLVGWIFRIELFKRVAAGFVAMNPATAISFIAAGAALLILRDR